jgi:solute carrier family 13 (sodium-dependent dicarboxylate transporter), member 2/3/5
LAKAEDTSPNYSLFRQIALWLGPALMLLTAITSTPQNLSQEGWLTLGLAGWMACWWAAEVIAIPVTALLPLVVLPLLGLVPLKQVAPAYAHPIIFLFLGGFMVGIAMQRWNLHRRLALLILLKAGTAPRRQIAGFMLATAFLSMWVSNTATSIMMLPIAMSVIALMDAQDRGGEFPVALLLGVAYSASIGGIATLIGTPPNALLAAYLQESQGIEIGFAQWMMVGLPVSLTMLVLAWWWLCRRDMPVDDSQASAALFKVELQKMGPISPAEKRVLTVFALTAGAWVFRPLFNDWLPGINDTVIALTEGLVLFVVPSGSEPRTALLDWNRAAGLPWGVLLLFGGGLALADTIQHTGLASWLAGALGGGSALPVWLLVGFVVAVIIFLTELTSNTATTATFLPLLGAFALTQSSSPLLFVVPAAIAASCAFMMPVATPPNAVVFGSEKITIGQMMSHGLALNLMGIPVVTGLAYFVVANYWL